MHPPRTAARVPGLGGRAQVQIEGAAPVERLVGPDPATVRGPAARRRSDGLPRSRGPYGTSLPAPTGMPASEDGARPQVRQIRCVDIAQVALAALDRERRLGDDRETQPAELRHASGGITAPCSMRSPARRTGAAPRPHRAETRRMPADPARVTQWTATARPAARAVRTRGEQVVERWRVVVVEQQLHGAT